MRISHLIEKIKKSRCTPLSIEPDNVETIIPKKMKKRARPPPRKPTVENKNYKSSGPIESVINEAHHEEDPNSENFSNPNFSVNIENDSIQ